MEIRIIVQLDLLLFIECAKYAIKNIAIFYFHVVVALLMNLTIFFRETRIAVIYPTFGYVRSLMAKIPPHTTIWINSPRGVLSRYCIHTSFGLIYSSQSQRVKLFYW